MGRYYHLLPWPLYDGKRSIEWLKKAINREPRNAWAYVYLAETCMHEGMTKEALTSIETCLRIAPGTLDAPMERRAHTATRTLQTRIEKR